MNIKNTKNFQYILLVISILCLSSCSKHKKNKPNIEQKKLEQQKIKKPTNKLSIKERKKEKRQQRKTEQTKTLSLMSFEELKKARDILLKKNDKDAAAKFTQKMLTMAPPNDIKLISEVTIELADLYFDLGKLKKAELIYTEYSRLYPGSKAIEYMSYKAILCSFYRTLKSENDQTRTNDTIVLANAFINRKDIFKQYIDEVETIRISCYKKAIESDVNIFNFYLNQGRIISAQNRLENMRKDWLNKHPEVSQQIAQLENQLKTTVLTMAKQQKSNRQKQMIKAARKKSAQEITKTVAQATQTEITQTAKPEVTQAQTTATDKQKSFTARF